MFSFFFESIDFVIFSVSSMGMMTRRFFYVVCYQFVAFAYFRYVRSVARFVEFVTL